MNSFEMNKMAGAVLGTALFVLLVPTIAEGIFETEAPETPVYLGELALAEPGGEHGGGGKPAPAEDPIAVLLASAEASAGENVAKKCVACHSFDKGGKNGTGPNLWDIVNRPIAAHEGFNYSSGMTSFAEGGKAWDYEALDAFLAKPKAYVDGTKMAFGGLSKGKDRANLIAYLRTLSDSPAALPEMPAEAMPANEDQADAGPAATETASAAMATDTETDTATDTSSAGAAMTAPAASGSESTAEAATDSETTMAAAPAEGSEAATGGAGDANPVLAMIGSEDPAAGEKVARKCKACHSFEEGGKNKVGPALWNIVNRPVASVDGFKYSNPMKEHAEGGATWTYADLDAFMAKPKDFIPGTKMAFAGLKKESDRAALLAYLRTLSAEPAPLP